MVPLTLLATACVAVSFLRPGAAVAGDCTAIEAASYRIDPRSVNIAAGKSVCVATTFPCPSPSNRSLAVIGHLQCYPH